MKVSCEGLALDNVFKFKYLGTLFAADADQAYDIEARIAMAMTRCGQLKHVFNSGTLNLKLKLRLYQASICSLMTYGCETWDLTTAAQRRLNNANSLMLARFTGQSIPQEARPATTSFNLVRHIRVRRLKWVGQILRKGPGTYQFSALKAQRQMNKKGNMLMDAPQHDDVEDLIPLAMNKTTWMALTKDIP